MAPSNPAGRLSNLLTAALVCGAISLGMTAELISAPPGQGDPGTAQAAPPTGQQPSTQPATQPSGDDALQRLLELQRQGAQTPPAAPEPEAAPAEEPATAPAEEDPSGEAAAAAAEDEFFGPPYPPATPPDQRRKANGYHTGEVPGGPPPQTRPAEEVTAAGETTSETVEPQQAPRNVATEESEWFNFSGMPWEEVIKIFAEKIGKPLMSEELLVFGELTYQSDRKFTKEEAIDELNLIMHTKGYRFVETPHHIYIVPLSEMPMNVPAERIFASREEFEEADLRPMDYVTAFIQIEKFPASKIQDMFETMVPDSMTFLALEDTNQMKMTGLVQDLEKVLSLMDRISLTPDDPREFKIFQVKTNAADIERLVRDLLDLGGGPRTRLQRDPRTGRMMPVQSDGDAEEVTMVADERTNTILVKATPARLEQIGKLIEDIDKAPDIGEFKTTVIEIKHASATDVANLLNTILSQEQGSTTQTPQWQRLRQLQQLRAQRAARRGQPNQPAAQPAGGVSPEDLLGEGIFERAKKTIRIAADERTNTIIVYANQEGQERVQKLLETIDRPQPTNFQAIAIENADAGEIFPTVTQIAQNISAQGTSGRGPTVVLDANNNQLYVFAEREQMQQIVDVIQELDIAPEEGVRHVIELKNIAPSRVADRIRPMLMDAGGAAATPSPSSRIRSRLGRRTMPGASAATTGASASNVEIIPLDEAQILIVICSEEDWTKSKVEETIRLWDERAVFSTPKLETFELQNGDAQNVADTLNSMYRGQYNHPSLGRSQVLVQAEGNAVLVYAVRPAIEEIAPLIEALDRADSSQYVILPLAHADATQVAQEAQQLFGGGGAGRNRFGPRGGGGGEVVIQPEPVTNSLIVMADAATLEKVKDFAQQRDESVSSQLPEQRFFTLRHALPREVASAVQSIYGGGAGRFRGQQSGTQVKAVATESQVIIEAPRDKLGEIESFIAQLDDPQGQEIVIKTIKLQGVDVTQIARRLTAAFRQKRNVTAVFDADPGSETILLTVSRDALEEAERLITEYQEASAGVTPVVEFRQMQHAEAQQAAQWLREQLITYMEGPLGRQAAQRIRVDADPRTNRIVINGPSVAVEYGKMLLEQYDVPVDTQPKAPIFTEVWKLPGLDVQNLARSLEQAYRARPRRPDGLRASFESNEATQSIIVQAPEDLRQEITELVQKFTAETVNLEPEQKFIAVSEADATYVANQVRGLLIAQISRTRGRAVADRIAISVDDRLNRIVINAPKFALEMAEALVQEFDKPPIESSQLRTIALENADANTVYNVLRQIFEEKIRAKSLRLSVEPLTNALIVGGPEEDFQEIQKWAKELDDQAITKKGVLRIVELMNANPWEIRNILVAQFAGGGHGRRQKLGAEYSFEVVGGRSVVVQAPESKLPEILELIDRLDNVGVDKVEVRTYELTGIGRGIHDLANEVTRAMNQMAESRERRVTITPYEAADTLIVTARTDQFEDIEEMMDKFKAMVEKETTVTKFIKLEYLDAARYASMIQSMLANKLSMSGQRGTRSIQNLSITADPRTNRLICYVPPKIVPDLEEVIAQLDVEAEDYEGQLRTVELANADANQVANILRPMFEQTRNQQRQQDISQIVVRIQAEPITNSLLVTASDEDFKEIEKQAQWIDEKSILDRSDPVLIELEYADPNEILRPLQDAFKETGASWGTRTNQQREVTISVVGAKLLVQAPKEKLEEVQALVAKLDQPDTENPPVTIALKYADPNQMVQMINALYRPRSRNAQQQVQATIVNGQLVVQAPKGKLAEIRSLIEEIDSIDTSLQVKTYALKLLNAREVAAQVQLYLRSVTTQGRGGMQPGAFAEATTNSLVVIAPSEHMPFIESLIAKLESIDMPESEAQTFVLEHARAEQVAQNLDTMLKAKIAEREGQRARQVQEQVAVVSDARNNRIFVLAPPQYQQLASELVRMVDQEVETGDIVHIVTLEQADATAVAESIRKVIEGNREGSLTPAAQSGTATVRVTADAASNCILLAGMPRDIAEVEKWIHDLESKSAVVPELQIFQLKYALAEDIAETLESLFATGGTGRLGRGAAGPMDMVTITADDYYNRLTVTANRRKMRQVEAFVQQLDQAVETVGEGLRDASGRELYFVDVYRGDAWDIAFDVRDMLPPEERGGPIIESDWFGEYIKVKCRPAEFDRIVNLIRQFEARARVETKVAVYPLGGRQTEEFLTYLQQRMGPDELVIERAEARPRGTLVEALWEEGEEPPAVQKRRERNGEGIPAGGIAPTRDDRAPLRPFKLGMPISAALLDDVDNTLAGDTAPPPPRQTTQPAERETPRSAGESAAPGVRRSADESAAPAAQPAPVAPPPPPGALRKEEPRTVAEIRRDVPTDPEGRPLEREKTRIVVQPDNTVLIYGPEQDVDEVIDTFDLLKEDLAVGEVIRIFQFKYGDVTAAAEVVNIMFNDRQVIQLPQQQQQQQQAQRRQQQQQQRGEEGEGREGREQPSMMEQLQRMTGGRQAGGRQVAGGQRIRIATDPGHNYLIVKCQESDLPELRQLLRELDIPPGEVNLRVFQLYNLDAQETAENIKDVLGINKVQQRRTGSRMPARGGNAQQQLMEMIQQQLVSVPGVEGGAKVERVEIVPNAITNSLLVSAPPEVMGLIENIITDLEELEGRDIVGIHHFELENAKVADVLPLLQEVFTAAGGGGGRRGPRGGGASPGALGNITISGDPRNNTIIFTAEAKDVAKVIAQIKLLDIPGGGADAETYICKFGDATAIAQVVEALYASGGGGRRPGAAGGVIPGEELRIVAEPTTNSITVWGTLEKRDRVLAKAQQLDLQSQRDIREIDVLHADPEELADKLLSIFGGSGGGVTPVQGRGRGGPSAAAGGPVTIIGDKNTKKLLVRAPQHIFLQIEDLVATLDQQDEGMQVKRYVLENADAESVVQTLQSALMEFVQMRMLGQGGRLGAGGGGLGMDPFTVVPDPRTNSILVVGSEQTFTFVDGIIATIDQPLPQGARKEFRVFVLEKADAEMVAEAINALATGQTLGASAQPGGRRAGGMRSGRMPMMGGGGGTLSDRLLDVQATADTVNNAVMVYGKAADIETVAEQIISQYEETIRNQRMIATVDVENVKPTEIVSFIWQFLGAQQAQGQTGRRGARGAGAGAGERPGPHIIPNDNNQTLVVRGTPAEVEEIRALVEQFDDPSLITTNITVMRVPPGQDVTGLASEIERIVNESEERYAELTGRQPRRISIAPDEFTRALIVAGDPAMFGLVSSVITQLGEIREEGMITTVIQLDNLSSSDVTELINDLQQRRNTGGTRRATPRSTTPSRTNRPRSSGRRGDATWPHMRGAAPTIWERHPAPGFAPYVGAALFAPGLAGELGDALWQQEQPPRGTRPRQQEEPEGNAAAPAFGRRALREMDPQEQAEAPGTQPAPDLTGVSGELMGDLTVTPVDSKRIIIQGYQSDVEFVLNLLKMMESSASPAVIEVFKLQNAKATALAPILEQAIEARIQVSRAEDRFSVSAEGRSNSLIVAASAELMNEIRGLIDTLDVVRPDGVEPYTVALQNIRASEAVSIIRPALEELYRIQEIPQESQASVSAVDRTNSVLIVGTQKDVADIRKLLESIDIAVSAEDKQASFIYADAVLIQLKNGRAEDIAEVLNEMIEEQQEAAREAKENPERAGRPYVTKIRLRMEDGRELPELDLERPISIVPEPGTNSLIIFSSPDNNQALREIVGVFDSLPPGAETELRTVVLQHARAEQIAEIVREVFENKSPLKRPSAGGGDDFGEGELPPVPTTKTGQGLPYNLLIQHDERSNTIVLVGRMEAVLLAHGLIQELDKPSIELVGKPALVPLKHYQATVLAEKLVDMLEERSNALGADENVARDSAVIVPDDRANILIVFAAPDVLTMITELAQELDAAENYRVVTTRFRRLDYGDAQKLQGILEQLFERKAEAERDLSDEAKDMLNVIADTRSNSLMLVGTRDYLAEAEALLDNLDQRFDPTVVMRVKPVKLNSAQNIATLLQEMVDNALKQQDSQLQGTPIHIAADPLSDSLLLAASQEDMEHLERWVDILDRPTEVGRMTRILPLSRGSAEEVAQVAEDVFQNSGGENIDISITHDPFTNSVVAFGPPAILENIAQFVRELDEVTGLSGAMIRIFKLQQADAEDAGELLNFILEGRGGTVGGGGSGGGGQNEDARQVLLLWQQMNPELGMQTLRGMRADVRVIADVRTNSLVVLAPPETMPLMESLVNAIDVPPDAKRVRLFALRNADAEQMAEMLRELFEAGTTGGRQGGAAGGESERQLVLGDMLGGRQEVSFTTDLRTNSVIAAGTPGYLDVVEELVLQLDTVPISDRAHFVYAPRNMVAEDLAGAIRDWSEQERERLQELGDQISLAVRQETEIGAIPHEESNRIIVSASPRKQAQVLDIIRQLDMAPPQVSIEVLIVEVSMANSLELGVEFAWQDLQYTKAGVNDTTTFDYVGGTDVGAAGAGLGGFTFTITGRDFNFLLRTLQSENSLNVLSRPHIVAMDNQAASIEITDSVPYNAGTTVTTGGIAQTNVAREDVGIKLEVTPQINPDGFVRLEIRQEVSDVTDSNIAIGGGVTAPIFNKRIAETVVTVQDNETVVLGGLIQTRDSKTEQKIPLMGDIPLLGPLFRFQNDDVRKSELLIILTPRVVRAPEDYRRISEEARDQTGLIPDEVKMNPLLRKLQVRPENLEPVQGEELLGPYGAPEQNGWREEDEPADNREQYGPVPPVGMPKRVKPSEASPNSYEIPIGMLSKRG